MHETLTLFSDVLQFHQENTFCVHHGICNNWLLGFQQWPAANIIASGSISVVILHPHRLDIVAIRYGSNKPRRILHVERLDPPLTQTVDFTCFICLASM